MIQAPAPTVASFLLLLAATFVLASRYGKRVGVAAAILTASGLLDLFRMSYPATALPIDALWVTSLAVATGTSRRDPAVAGAAAGLAISLAAASALVGVPIVLFLLFRPERSWQSRIRTALVFAGASAAVFVAARGVRLTAGEPGGVGGVFGLVSFAGPLLVLLLLFLAAPFVVPGPLTLLLMTAAVADLIWPFLGDTNGFVTLPSFGVVAIVSAVAIASVDALWRRSRLPKTDVAVAAVTLVLVALEHV